MSMSVVNLARRKEAMCALWLWATLAMLLCKCAGPSASSLSRALELRPGESTVHRESCAIPGVVIKPSGTQFARQAADASVLGDRRLAVALGQEQDGLLGISHGAFLELLCEWADASSKIVLLELLASNRETIGDIEAAIWFGEKSWSISPPSIQRKFPDRPVRIAEWYTVVGDLAMAGEWMRAAESVLAQRRDDDAAAEGAFRALARMARLSARQGDTETTARTLNRLNDISWPGRSKEAPQVTLVVDQVKRMIRAMVARMYVDAGKLAAGEDVGLEVLNSSIQFKGWAVPPSAQWFKDLLYEGARAGALDALIRGELAEGKGEAALEHLREYDQSTRRLLGARDEMVALLRVGGPEARMLYELLRDVVSKSIGYLDQAQVSWSYGRAFLLAGC